ncbi:MAG: hypothetical protein FJ006_08190 [Chloroflexi bacterium]|nr:hypothetical protein [Chloroflexota bacterium]
MWAIVALVSLAVLIALFLCVPLDLALHFNTDRRPRFSMKLVWLFGLVKTEVRKKKKPEEKRTTAEHKRKPRDWGRDVRVIFEVLRTKGMLSQIIGLLKGVLKRLKIGELVANIKVGLDNPADTGLLFAFIAPVNLLISFLRYPIKVEPSFAGDAFLQGYFFGAVRMQPIQLIAPLAGFAFSLPTIRAIKTLVLSKWKGK